MESLVYIALFSPLVGSIFAALFGMSPKRQITGVVTSALLFVSFVASVLLLRHVMAEGPVHVELMDWIVAGDMRVPFGFTVDQVTAVMMSVVTLVSTVDLLQRLHGA